MDLNYLLARQQLSLMQADRATCASSRFAHRARASAYGARIIGLHASAAAFARKSAIGAEG